MMKMSRLAVAALVCGSVASAQILYDNGSIVTLPGGHASGGDISLLQNVSLGETTLGYGHAISSGFRVADDFTVTGTWTIDSICFMAYQTGVTAPSITGYDVKIWDGVPGALGSNVVASSNTLLNSGFTNIYRIAENSPNTDTARRVQESEVDFGGAILGAGTYWLDWAAAGSSTSGPWAPPISPLGMTAPAGANALQFNPSVGAWGALQDGGSMTPDELPFVIKGTPTPGSLAVLGFAGLAATRRRR
ncbi:MAG: hypothetical protein ACF8SC_12885 [Phycisphaerales bacterium JB037]